jgi:methionine biosynthesis protein MetW
VYRVILDLVKPGSSVLDLGCSDGGLLSALIHERKVRGQGVEIDERAIRDCVARGVGVSQQDIDTGLSEYGDRSFDYVILNQSLQKVKKPEWVLEEALRVAGKVIVAFANFAHYPARLQLFFRGRAPVTRGLPYQWYDTPNLHFLSISDFQEFCRQRGYTIENESFLAGGKAIRLLPNLRADLGIFLISLAGARSAFTEAKSSAISGLQEGSTPS